MSIQIGIAKRTVVLYNNNRTTVREVIQWQKQNHLIYSNSRENSVQKKRVRNIYLRRSSMIKLSKILIIVLIIACLLQTVIYSTATAVAAHGMTNFKRINTYTSKTFSDISPKQLYYQDVVNAYSYGIMSGIGNSKFNPTAYISIAEAIVIATKMNSIYNGGIGKIAPAQQFHLQRKAAA